MDICDVGGGVNGGFQVLSKMTEKFRIRIKKMLSIRENRFSHRLLRTVITFVLVDVSWFFFRIKRLRMSLSILKSIIMDFNPWIFFDGSLFWCGLDRKNFYLLFFSIAVLLTADYGKYRGLSIHKKILQQDFWFRWLVFAGGALFVLIFGVWGGNYDANSFIYFQF